MITRPTTRSDAAVRLRSHAKLNLFLTVLGPRPDGYHEVETILHAVDLYDDIDVVLTREPGVIVEMTAADGVVTGPLPQARDNLITRAAEALAAAGDVRLGAYVRVAKRIPVAAGLGGGSGNAAAALLVLAELWDLGVDRQDLLRLAAQVGTDVSYCLVGGTALATGRGELLTPLPRFDPLWFVLAGMHYPLSTRAVYDALETSPLPPERSASAAMTLALGAGDVEEVAALLHNDLEPPAFALRPELAEKKAALVRAGALGASMSGSGPTMFAMARDAHHARDIAGRVTGDFDWVRVVESRTDCVQRLD